MMSDTLTPHTLADLLVQNVTDYAIYMLDPKGIISSWNAGAARFKGYRADEIIGEHFSRFYSEEDRATGLPARALAVALAEGRFEAFRGKEDAAERKFSAAKALIEQVPANERPHRVFGGRA